MNSLRRSRSTSRARISSGVSIGNRLLVSHGQLAGERGLLELADHEAGHVVEHRRDDAAVRASRRALERAPQHDLRDHVDVLERRRRCRRSSGWRCPRPRGRRSRNPAPADGNAVAERRTACSARRSRRGRRVQRGGERAARRVRRRASRSSSASCRVNAWFRSREGRRGGLAACFFAGHGRQRRQSLSARPGRSGHSDVQPARPRVQVRPTVTDASQEALPRRGLAVRSPRFLRPFRRDRVLAGVVALALAAAVSRRRRRPRRVGGAAELPARGVEPHDRPARTCRRRSSPTSTATATPTSSPPTSPDGCTCSTAATAATSAAGRARCR